MVEPAPTRHCDAAIRLGAAVRTRTPALVEVVVARILAEIPVYTRGDVVGVDELRRSVRHNVDYIVAGLTAGSDAAADLRAPAATGRARAAQGAPLVDMLTAFRLGFTETWNQIRTCARELGDIGDDVLVELAGHVFSLQNSYLDAGIDAYREEARAIVRTHERERAVLAETVLSGVPAHGSLWEVAQALRLPMDGVFVVVMAAADLGHDPMPRVESALAAVDVASVWRLETEFSLGLVSLGTHARSGTVLDTVRRHATGPTGVSPAFDTLDGAPRACRLARLALDGIDAREPRVAQFSDRPLNILLASSPQAATDTARVVLGPLLGLPPDDRDLLLDTLGAWIDHGGSAQDAAAVLHCHPNTVRYRLRRIETSTGRSLGDPSDTAEIVAAARAWAALPRPRT